MKTAFATLFVGVLALLTSSVTFADSEVVVNCDSWDYRPTSCYTGVSNDFVELIQQNSAGRGGCEYGRSWSYDRSNIYVSDGCRATFRVWARIFNMNCESYDYNDSRCYVSGRINSVELVQQLSHGRGRCEFGRSWGFDGNSIWVNGGCRAVFRVNRQLPRDLYGID